MSRVSFSTGAPLVNLILYCARQLCASERQIPAVFQAVSSGVRREAPKTPKPASLGRVSAWCAEEADDGVRTRDPQLGKLMLYQLSYVRVRLRITDSGVPPWRRKRRRLPLVYCPRTSRSESRVLGDKRLRSLGTAVFQASHKDEAIHGGKPTLPVGGLSLQDCQEPRR